MALRLLDLDTDSITMSTRYDTMSTEGKRSGRSPSESFRRCLASKRCDRFPVDTTFGLFRFSELTVEPVSVTLCKGSNGLCGQVLALYR